MKTIKFTYPIPTEKWMMIILSTILNCNYHTIKTLFNILIHKRLESQTIANALFSISIGIFVWSLANDVILAGKGSFVVLLSAFIDKIIDNDSREVGFKWLMSL